jgi:HSP20 family protein
MARDNTQQNDQRGNQPANAASTSATAGPGNRTQAQVADRERSISTNREQPRQGQASTGAARRQGTSVSRQGRGFDNPVSLMQRMADDMDRLLEQFGFGRSAASLTPGFGSLLEREPWSTGALANLPNQSLWSPEVDVLRRGDKLVVRADVPGMNKDDLHVDVEDNVLTIRGERREEHEDRDEGVFRSERSYGEFYRAIPLPEGVNADQCEAKYENGVLEVELQAPQQESASRRIPIR